MRRRGGCCWSPKSPCSPLGGGALECVSRRWRRIAQKRNGTTYRINALSASSSLCSGVVVMARPHAIFSEMVGPFSLPPTVFFAPFSRKAGHSASILHRLESQLRVLHWYSSTQKWRTLTLPESSRAHRQAREPAEKRGSVNSSGSIAPKTPTTMQRNLWFPCRPETGCLQRFLVTP